METALLIILPLLVGGCSIITFFIARSAEAHKKGHNDGTLKADIQYIKENVTAMRREQEKVNDTLNRHLERIIVTEKDTRDAHIRINNLKDELKAGIYAPAKNKGE